MTKKYNTNSNSDHSRKLRQDTANKATAAKLADGVYKQFLLRGLAADMDAIEAAIAAAGGSRVQALKKICAEWQAMRG